jgi:hypothetical protein
MKDDVGLALLLGEFPLAFGPGFGSLFFGFWELRNEEDGKHPHKQQRHAHFLPTASLCHETL